MLPQAGSVLIMRNRDVTIDTHGKLHGLLVDPLPRFDHPKSFLRRSLMNIGKLVPVPVIWWVLILAFLGT
jgi:hypothetical protein